MKKSMEPDSSRCPELSAELLARLAPLRALSTDELLLLASKLHTRPLAADEVLFQHGDSDSDDYFLLGGRLQLTEPGAKPQELTADTEAALFPILPDRPRQCTVRALEESHCLVVDGQVLAALQTLDSPTAAGGVQQILENSRLSKIEDNALSSAANGSAAGNNELPPREARRLEASFKEDLEKNRFVLTSLPEVALKVRGVLDNPRMTATEIAGIISNDPAIAAKIIRVSNSPLYRSWVPCDTVRDALVRLGVDTTRELVLSFTLKDLFKVEIEPVKAAMQDAWRHIVYHGAIAWVIARESGRFQPEEAMTAALMSNIGVLSICNYLENHPEIYEKKGGIESAISHLKADVGALMLERWGVSEQLVECARHTDDWDRDHDGEPDLCDLVIIAACHAYISHRKVPPLDTITAFQRLNTAGLLNAENALVFLESAREQVAEARAMLDF